MRPWPLHRDHWRRETDRLDPATEHEQISRILAMHEFPWDLQQALSFALFRTYAVPSIGNLLARTGEFIEDTQKRHDDTVLVLEAVLDDGLESKDGRAAVRRMNQMHGSYDISNDDMLYVLSTFVVTPARWIRRYGWRDLTENELSAATHYYRRLGRLMGIKDMPEDFDGFARLMDEYEAHHFAYDEGARRVADSTLDLFTTFYPRPLRPLLRAFSIALLDDHLARAFGYDKPPAWFSRLAHASLAMRGRLLSRFPARAKPWKARTSHRIRSYPGGFMVENLGTFPSSMPDDEQIDARLQRPVA
ncbi:oxygenase MpaB family protein [Aeromicrobium sp. CTD01-1L150]|uniref:oxygenase MpaB family protein n=1 Tax=Aeromicrobium sp. CTD01-1L150 TaxID=3341830 RepID=UPI0035C11FF2